MIRRFEFMLKIEQRAVPIAEILPGRRLAILVVAILVVADVAVAAVSTVSLAGLPTLLSLARSLLSSETTR